MSRFEQDSAFFLIHTVDADFRLVARSALPDSTLVILVEKDYLITYPPGRRSKRSNGVTGE